MSEIPYKKPEEGKIQTWVFGIILIGLFLLVCRLFAPFMSILLWSILLFIIVEPLHKRIARKITVKTHSGRFLRRLLAAFFALGTALVILVPLGFVISQIYVQL
ncbi:MAG: hypothetical protein LBD22_02890, partial [Spirochaetaceae bacterium]|nr:hypothetical protein [Spirochaetaceae bacterium]